LLLEGGDIQQLLAQVRTEHGPAARIVAADRVRATGLTGLFSRERYELTIEVADVTAMSMTAIDMAAIDMTAIDMAAIDRGDLSSATTAATSPADALVALVEAQERQLLPYVDSDVPASTGAAPQVAHETGAATTAFAEVLSGFGAPAWKVPVVSGGTAVTPAPTTPQVAPPRRPVVIAPPAATPAPRPVVAPDVPDTPLIPRYQPVRLPADAPLATVLAHLGLPKQLEERVSGVDSYRAIVKVLKLLPEAPKPPARAGQVLVVVGELHRALAVARTVSESLRLTPARMVLAAASCAGTGIHPSRRLVSPEHAVKRIAKLRRTADLPIIVVVDTPADGSGTEWARSIRESFDAAAVWAVVDATGKTADSARRLADIGHVDAIAAYACASTGDPATVLQLGVPVALLDGRIASPHVWADLLCRRLEEVVD
jgi:hypothetical protein